MWARGYLCGTAGEVDQETIKRYIETQGKEEGNENFQIVEEQLLSVELLADFSRWVAKFAHEKNRRDSIWEIK